ncbi:MAG: sensor histidine kinase, partial [Gemmatimonadota bacterium]
VLDLSERLRLEKALLDQSETERRRLGQDLHDGLGQHLTGLAFLGKALEERLQEKGSPEAKDAAKIATLAEQAIAKARSLAQLVSPVSLQAGGLLPALTRLADNIQDVFDISCVVVPSMGDVTTRDEGVATHLFHITQEAVTNAIKHGHAKSIRIQVRTRDSRLTLSIQDNGLGMPDRPRSGEGLGLGIMRHRARMIGATLEHRGSPGGGTIVVCTQHAFRHIATAKEAKDGSPGPQGRRPKRKKKNSRRR